MFKNHTVEQGAATFGSTDPIGGRIVSENESFEVVGVVPNIQGEALGVKPPPAVFVPLTKRAYSRPPSGGMTLMVRASAPGGDAINEIRHEIATIDPNLSERSHDERVPGRGEHDHALDDYGLRRVRRVRTDPGKRGDSPLCPRGAEALSGFAEYAGRLGTE
jgi:hypothetical protein